VSSYSTAEVPFLLPFSLLDGDDLDAVMRVRAAARSVVEQRCKSVEEQWCTTSDCRGEGTSGAVAKHQEVRGTNKGAGQARLLGRHPNRTNWAWLPGQTVNQTSPNCITKAC
jgi:hypothetical protein